jgi:hypothetical protein
MQAAMNASLARVQAIWRSRPSRRATVARKPSSRSDFSVAPKRLPERSQSRAGATSTEPEPASSTIVSASSRMLVSTPDARL